MRLAVHEAIANTDGIVFRCTLSGLDVDRRLEVSAWTFEGAAFPDHPRLATSQFVNMSVLTALSDLIDQASKNLLALSDTLPSDTLGSPRPELEGGL
jgi:hypothetical protein